ncbi:MAG: nickel-dependent lactate racemase [Synergistaceae bacterium]|jgi:nickel-dependent lactate racemase|nr:nickel-dependent lactate racemase [Synergistaceae bacterium]
MGIYELKFGREKAKIEVREEELLGVMKSREVPCAATEEEAVLKALENPVGSPRISEKVKPGETVCIVTCDLTRSWQHPAVYLPLLVGEIKKGGVRDEDIFFLVGTGTHRSHTPEEHRLLLGEKLYGRYKVWDHESQTAAMTDFGKTSFGTPVRLNKMAADADHVILTGGIVYHFMSGWGGGRKSVLPGISSYETVMANHALALKPLPGKGRNWVCRGGNAEGNLIHLDMTEAAEKLAPSFLLNVIMSGEGKIGWAVAGDWRKAHEAGRDIVDSVDRIPITQPAELVVASACGYPKDINFYQSTKALFNAEAAALPGAAVVILASCVEGYGNEEMQMMLQKYKNSDEREVELRHSFTIAKYIGYCAGQAAERFDFHLVTDIDPELLAGTGIKISRTLDEALKKVHAAHGTGLKTWLMPHGANTLPVLPSLPTPDRS